MSGRRSEALPAGGIGITGARRQITRAKSPYRDAGSLRGPGRLVHDQCVSEGLEKVKDAFHDGLDGCRGCRGCLSDVFSEALLVLAICGLIGLGWWSFRVAPYPTVSIGVGVLLLAAYGVIALVRDVRGKRLIGGLGVAGVVAAGIIVLLLSYLPFCRCFG